MKNSVKAIIFDWGDTVMRDFNLPGPMYLWKSVAWVPGVETALKYLSSKHPCIIATSANYSNTSDMIKTLWVQKKPEWLLFFFNELGLKGSFPNADYTIQHMSELTQLFDE